MLVIGAGGLVAQMIDELSGRFGDNLVFWSESEPKYDFLRQFKRLQNDKEVEAYFFQDSQFILGIGNPAGRKLLAEKFERMGGKLNSFVSSDAQLSQYAHIQPGNTILGGVVIEAGSFLGKGCLVNRNVLICHGSTIGEYCEIAPAVVLCGDVQIGANSFIGAGAVVIPGIKTGDNCLVAAGSVINKNVSAGALVAGVPGIEKIKRN